MAFTEDSLKAKLASLNETQDSISTVGQWILFHSWTSANCPVEIAQQAKIRKKDEFLKAFDPIIVEGSAAAYKGSGPDIQNKIRRVIEVWRQRSVFRLPVQDEIERALNDIDKSRSTRKPALGGSLFSGSSLPPELKPVEPMATAVQKAELNVKPSLTTANQEYEKLTNPNNPIPTPPVHAAHLAELVKKLAMAESAVADGIKARKELVAGLEKLLESNKAKVAQEESQLADLKTRKEAIDLRKREVESAILRGLSAAETTAISAAPLPGVAQVSHERPDVEELTPPPVESFTPVGSPTQQPRQDAPPIPADDSKEPSLPPAWGTPNPEFSAPAATASIPPPSIPGADLLRSLTHARQDDNGTYAPTAAKKRKMSQNAAEEEFAVFAADDDMNGIDSNLGDLI
ncbi:hypothetical protein DM02DRAFT_644139 [Periconia macrospinosa]|uniref:CID domain-containing protein n=1 Tax=Periconia macrospinosa TaxID=97972 RepID=A0A2V1DH48_9PLEO|nr:hypothetical protein DM02DRAFT_644139 [Periconia macrospinosa]